MNILVLNAHPDDLELMAGGAVARWISEGHVVRALTLTDGSWTNPDGTIPRQASEALAEERAAAATLGYTVENLQEKAMELRFEDRLVCRVLERIEQHRIDNLVCPYEGDLHHDHEVVSRIAVAASRRVGRVLMGQINSYVRHFFCPNVFVDITDTWEKKMAALQCYQSEFARAGEQWQAFQDATTRSYGQLVGVQRAEGFVCHKFLMDS